MALICALINSTRIQCNRLVTESSPSRNNLRLVCFDRISYAATPGGVLNPEITHLQEHNIHDLN